MRWKDQVEKWCLLVTVGQTNVTITIGISAPSVTYIPWTQANKSNQDRNQLYI